MDQQAEGEALGLFKVVGMLAHQSRPKKFIEVTRIIRARDIIEALEVYTTQLKGVKRAKWIEVRRLREGK